MKRTKHVPTTLDTQSVVPASGITVSYLGMDGSRCVLGEGRVTGLVAQTLNVQGDWHVKPGMDLALIIGPPESDNHVCLVGAQVTASTWNTFTVDLRQVPETAQAQLKCILENVQAKPSFSYQEA